MRTFVFRIVLMGEYPNNDLAEWERELLFRRSVRIGRLYVGVN